jgi:hypothetical protein
MNANRTGRDDTELAFRAFQVDRTWYDSYWEEAPRLIRASLVSRFIGLLIAVPARLRQLANETPPEVSRAPVPGDRTHSGRLVALSSSILVAPPGSRAVLGFGATQPQGPWSATTK